MGWERKRGKLAEFNRFVRGGAEGAFSVDRRRRGAAPRACATSSPSTPTPSCRPTRRPLLVGALAHPLNRAVYDPALGRVVRGYGILQPRVGVSLPSAHRSLFAAIHSGHPGVDPYTTAVSDVYQDLYGEGSFTGKGIYDVEAFEQATRGRFPENTLLSHDLIEGSYARAGLATDVDGLRRLPHPLPHLHPAEAPLDPGRLAAAALARPGGCRGPTGRSPTGSRCSPAGRSSTTSAAARSRSPSSLFLVARLDAAARLAASLDPARARRHRGALDRLAAARAAPAAARQVVARLLRGGGPRRGHQRAAAGARDRLPPAPGLGLGRRHRPHPLAAVRDPAPPARVADGVADRARR